jgi:hypothetical protein
MLIAVKWKCEVEKLWSLLSPLDIFHQFLIFLFSFFGGMGLDCLDKNKILGAGVSEVLSVMPLFPFMQIYLRSVEGFLRRQ